MNKTEEAKKELREYRENILYIREKQEDAEELTELMQKTTTRWSHTKTSNSMCTDQLSDKLDRLEEIKKIKDQELEKLLLKKFVIDEKIDKLTYPYRDILFMRYSRGKSWREITNKLQFSSEDYIYKLHGKALQIYSQL